MTIPVTLVTGFLGAGKTTFINRALRDAGGVRIAAIVNDFGSINIDADLISDVADSVVGLKNGCICCSLQGDLLRTLKQVVTRADVQHILIEASGVADPQGIIEALMDPVLHEAVRPDAVVAIVDAVAIDEDPGLQADPLWCAQTLAADFIGLSKTDEIDASTLRARFIAEGTALVFNAAEPSAFDLLVTHVHEPPRRTARSSIAADRFLSVEWTWAGAIGSASLRACIDELAPSLVRAKGIINLAEYDGASFSFNLVGRRATMEPLARRHDSNRLVLIGERGKLDVDAARTRLLHAFAPLASG